MRKRCAVRGRSAEASKGPQGDGSAARVEGHTPRMRDVRCPSAQGKLPRDNKKLPPAPAMPSSCGLRLTSAGGLCVRGVHTHLRNVCPRNVVLTWSATTAQVSDLKVVGRVYVQAKTVREPQEP